MQVKVTGRTQRNRVRGVFVMATLAFAVAVCVSVAGSPQHAPTTAASSTAAPSRALIDSYCAVCHNQRVKTAGIAFDTADISDVSKDADLWEKALRKLRGGMMPPPGARRPDASSVEAFTAALERELDAAAVRNPNPGRVG